MDKKRSKISYISGFSMIEVLVSIFVLAIGAIGAAAMQINAMQTTQQSGFHSAAVQLALDLVEKMSGNAAIMQLSDSSNPFLKIDYRTDRNMKPTPPRNNCYQSTSDCDAQQLAESEIYEVLSKMTASFPTARIVVCRDTAPWDDSVTSYRWDCQSTGQLTSIVIKIGWRELSDTLDSSSGANQEIKPRVVIYNGSAQV